MFYARNRIKEHFKCSRTEAEALILLSKDGYVTYGEFLKELFIAGHHVRKIIGSLRKKNFDIYSIHGVGYTMAPEDRAKVSEAANRP